MREEEEKMMLEQHELILIAILGVALIATTILLYRTSKELDEFMKGFKDE